MNILSIAKIIDCLDAGFRRTVVDAIHAEALPSMKQAAMMTKLQEYSRLACRQLSPLQKLLYRR